MSSSDNLNKKANTEMATAENAVRAAAATFAQTMESLRLAQLSLDEAIATSVNRDKACYQQVAGQIQGAFSNLVSAGEGLEKAFQHPMIQRITQAKPDQ